MATLLWEYIEIFLGRLRGIQRFYQISPSYYQLFIYDYVYVDEKVTTTIKQPRAEVGVDI